MTDPLGRILQIELPARQSAFLWGPRKTGKTTLLRTLFPQSKRFDLLETDLLLKLTSNPALLREQLAGLEGKFQARPVIIDEVQKVPQLLDEVHLLIENEGMQFILCGSSARKLKRGRANLLGGRAWRFELFPLVSRELGEFDLLKVLNRGLVPGHYLTQGYRKSLHAYTRDYLKEEVFDEGLTRNLPAFSRFFDAMAYSHGELTNYSNIARDCGVDSKTVKEYYQILVDTLLGTLVEPFKRRQDRGVLGRTPKFYLFDVGVAGALIRRELTEPRGSLFGRAFEHFIFMELTAHSSYADLHYPIRYWRTKSRLEVDFILGAGEVAIGVKGSQRVDASELRALNSFVESYKPRSAILVSNEVDQRIVGKVRIMPYRQFLKELWEGKIIR